MADQGHQAKIGDFETARAINMSGDTLTGTLEHTPSGAVGCEVRILSHPQEMSAGHFLTAAPGTMAYMPPEIYDHQYHPAAYTYPLDVFSLGVLMVQISTGRSPKPRPPLRKVRSLDARKGALWVRVGEIERRWTHIKLIPDDHPLLPIATDCLRDYTKQRPTAGQVHRRIQTIRVSSS
jgi:serine/threonine protein kinase